MRNSSALSDIEFELMLFFWDLENPVTFAEILRFCNEEKKWDWAKTTAHTYLTRLMNKGLLSMNHTAGTRRTYFARISREEFMRSSAQSFLDTVFSGSVKNFLLALTPSGSAFTRSEAEELHEILDRLTESENHPEPKTAGSENSTGGKS